MSAPLSHLKLGLSRLTDEKAVHRVAPALRAEVEYLDNLFSNLVYLVRLSTGTEVLHRLSTDMGELLERIQVRLSVVADDMKIEMAVAPPTSAISAEIEPIGMEHALTNLIRHAIKYASRHIAILIEQVDQTISISIRYDGDERAPFELAFSQPSFPDWSALQFTQVQRDVDLSISIAREIIEQHSGQIACHPHEQGGTEIRVNIKATQGTQAQSASHQHKIDDGDGMRHLRH